MIEEFATGGYKELYQTLTINSMRTTAYTCERIAKFTPFTLMPTEMNGLTGNRAGLLLLAKAALGMA